MNVQELGGLFASLTGKSEEEISSALNQIAQDATENETDPKEGVAKFLEDAFSAKLEAFQNSNSTAESANLAKVLRKNSGRNTR